MGLPWHDMTLNAFTNEDEVAAVLSANAPVGGMYIYPGGGHEAGLSTEEKAEAYERAMEKMQQSPLLFMSFHKTGVESMAVSMMFGLVNQIFAALLMTGLLLMRANRVLLELGWFCCRCHRHRGHALPFATLELVWSFGRIHRYHDRRPDYGRASPRSGFGGNCETSPCCVTLGSGAP